MPALELLGSGAAVSLPNLVADSAAAPQQLHLLRPVAKRVGKLLLCLGGPYQQEGS